MADPPKRRWFRFKLSTVLILTAIAAWAMACRPDPGLVYYDTASGREFVAGHFPNDFGDDGYWTFSIVSSKSTAVRHLQVFLGPNPELAYPTLALVAFLAWKAAWAVVERRRRTSATRLEAQSH